ncbi:UNVERIFIED_CONTAM: hypothetical protein Slati_4407400 [Sesamum latifolium]|uniref:GAG-pre-integrase domain-containing protein n=1 Tax=Sesamum latifolium TaxID=2727402 RepID=A0AAW2SPP4_9LAMI
MRFLTGILDMPRQKHSSGPRWPRIVCAESWGQDTFLVKMLEGLKAGLENDTYIDVILQSLPPSYNPFIVNYNMNGHEKSIHELINMLVQYEATTHKSEPALLVGEASTSKAKGKGARHWKRKKGKERRSQPLLALEVLLLPRRQRTEGRLGILSGRGQIMCACIAMERDIGRGSVHNSSPTQVLERSRKLSKDEMVLRLGDGKAVAAEAVGSLSLVISNLNDHENAQIWHATLGHISKDRIRKLVDSKNLEIDDLDHLPTCKSCLKGKMTKKPFVGQSAIATGLLDLVHTDVCGPLSTPARGGFSYFITFTDDHSRLEVENQTSRKIKALRSDQGELPPSFWGYALEMVAKLLNIAPSKMVPQTPYEIWHGKPTSYKFIGYPKETAGYYFYVPAEQKIFVSRNAVFLEKNFSSDSRCDEVLNEESSEELCMTHTSFEPPVHTDGVPVLHSSTRESRVHERYGFMGLSSQLDNDPKTYEKAMSDIDSDK